MFNGHVDFTASINAGHMTFPRLIARVPWPNVARLRTLQWVGGQIVARRSSRLGHCAPGKQDTDVTWLLLHGSLLMACGAQLWSGLAPICLF